MNDNVISPAAAMQRIKLTLTELCKRKDLMRDMDVQNVLRSVDICAQMLEIELMRINKELQELKDQAALASRRSK
jgi:hypothetical protein